MVLCAGLYFFSGFAKVTLAGPAWITGGNLRWILYGFNSHRGARTAIGLVVADRAWLTHVVAAGATAIELAFPLILWKPRLGGVLVGAVLLLHAGIWATMGLDYWAQAATVVAVFADWPAVDAWVSARRPGREVARLGRGAFDAAPGPVRAR